MQRSLLLILVHIVKIVTVIVVNVRYSVHRHVSILLIFFLKFNFGCWLLPIIKLKCFCLFSIIIHRFGKQKNRSLHTNEPAKLARHDHFNKFCASCFCCCFLLFYFIQIIMLLRYYATFVVGIVMFRLMYAAFAFNFCFYYYYNLFYSIEKIKM